MTNCFKTLTATIIAALVGGVILSSGAMAQADQPQSLDALLEKIRRDQRMESAADQRRIQEFRAARDKQQQLLNEIKRDIANEEARSRRLEATFNKNNEELAKLDEQLNEAVGEFGELFGLVRQVAGDAKGTLESSLISAQYADDQRAQFLADLGASKNLPKMADLNRFWYILQQEATAQGKVARFDAMVEAPDGTSSMQEVIRIGPFTATTEGQFVRYSAETGSLQILPRQPASRFRSAAGKFTDAQVGFEEAVIDPSRGAILGLLVQTPSLGERVDQGGTVGYVIIALAVLGLLLALFRIVGLTLTGMAVAGQKKSGTPSPSNPLGRILKTYDDNRGEDVENLELKLDEAILKETPRLEWGLNTIKMLAAIAPLLGLLGTVTGMIQTFQAITLFGTGDPKLMAGGISQALVTTVLGLVSAIPLILLHSLAAGRSKAVLEVLEEQAAGIVAKHAERRS